MLVVFAALAAAPLDAVAAKSIAIGNGYSALAEPEAAGAEAAAAAKAALGDFKAKVVIVFDSVEGGADGKQAMLNGVTSVFDAKIVYGCSAYAPITQDGNTGTVGVLALGGAIKAVPAVADVQGDAHEACGKEIGEALKPAVPEEGGRVVLLFGACHVPKNDKLVGGLNSVLGEKFPVAGGAAKGDLLYCKGRVLPLCNLGLLLTGDFTCGFSAKNAPGDDKEAVIAAAGIAAEAAAGGKKPTLLLTFDCGGRRGQMGGAVDQELALFKKTAGDAPIFGFYGSGEIGPADNDSAPKGVGYHIVVCAITAE